jgi:hypothetical protein
VASATATAFVASGGNAGNVTASMIGGGGDGDGVDVDELCPLHECAQLVAYLSELHCRRASDENPVIPQRLG